MFERRTVVVEGDNDLDADCIDPLQIDLCYHFVLFISSSIAVSVFFVDRFWLIAFFFARFFLRSFDRFVLCRLSSSFLHRFRHVASSFWFDSFRSSFYLPSRLGWWVHSFEDYLHLFTYYTLPCVCVCPNDDFRSSLLTGVLFSFCSFACLHFFLQMNFFKLMNFQKLFFCQPAGFISFWSGLLCWPIVFIENLLKKHEVFRK